MNMRYCSFKSIIKLTTLIVTCTLIVMLICACGSNTIDSQESDPIEADISSETVTPEKDDDKANTEQKVEIDEPEEVTPIVCVNVDYLRTRNAPSGDIIKETVNGQEHTIYAKRKGYVYSETVEKDGYKWYCIGENQWIGTEPDWIVESFLGEETGFEINSRVTFENTGGWAPHWIYDQADVIAEGLRLDSVQKDLMVYLKYAVPGFEQSGARLFDMDMANLTDEARSQMLSHLLFQGPVMILYANDYPDLLHETAEKFYMNASIEYDSDQDSMMLEGYGSLENVNMAAPMFLEEHLDNLTEQLYGRIIDFRTCDAVDFYDPDNKVIVPHLPFITGFGAEDTIPYVYEYSIESNMITAKVAAVEIYLDRYDWPNDIVGTAQQRAEIVIAIAENGNYQVQSVRVIE